MAKAGGDSSAFQRQTEKHMRHCKDAPEWMDQAVLAIALWNSGELTLQHSVALALAEVYEMGKRGIEMERVDWIKYFGKKNETHDNSGDHPTAIRVGRTRAAPVVDTDGVEPRPVRLTRVSSPQPEPVSPPRIGRSKPAPTITRIRRS